MDELRKLLEAHDFGGASSMAWGLWITSHMDTPEHLAYSQVVDILFAGKVMEADVAKCLEILNNAG